jgi:hypothetical protein
MRTQFVVASLVVGFLQAQSAPIAPSPQSTPPPSTPPAAAAPAKDAKEEKDGKKDEAVELKKELSTLEQVWKRRTALHWLKSSKETVEALSKVLDPTSASSIASLVKDDVRYDELQYHFVEKIRNCEQRVLAKLRNEKFRGVADLLEALASKQYPASVAYADLMGTIELNWRWAARRKLLDDGSDGASEETRELARRLAGETERIRGTAGHGLDEVAKDLWKETKPEDFPASWFDPSCEIISFEFGPVPETKEFPRVDLATATREQLLEVPEIEADSADAILRYRKRNGIRGPEELRFVDTLPRRELEPLQTLFTVTRGAAPAPRKQWTVMVYLNAANNLEPFGIKDMNEMESAGSTSEVNVLVECSRFHARPSVRPNGQYLSNPFAEHESPFYVGLDAAPGTRRYYILKDEDKLRVRSVMLENVGETDCGRPEPLIEFGRFAAENFPAEHYALVIWNHGAGWSGVSYDDNTKHSMDMPDVRAAMEGIAAALKKAGHPTGKVDVLDFDACLMATLEVAYELKDSVDFLASSQESEPGDGMAYGEYLRWLTTYPEAPPASLAKAMVETYVKAYAPGGVQVDGDHWSGGETKSAMRLARVAELKAAVEEVAKLLEQKPDLLGEVADQIVKETRRFGRLVDIQDFLAKVLAREKGDAALKAAAEKVCDLIGYPDDGKDRLVNEVIIKRRSPGAVIWGFNGWASPPRSLAPFVSNSRLAKTPLVGPDEKGDWVAKITFPPMLRNNKSGKLEFVTSIDWQFEGDPEKRVAKEFSNSFFSASFPSDAVVLAEGHNVGNNRSHGVSLYFPAYLGFDQDYRRLQFAQDSAWAALCEKFPIKKLENPKSIALLGLNHVTKSAREELGKAVVFEDLEKRILQHDFAGTYAEDLKALNREFDAIKDPKPYGEDWTQMLAHYSNAVIVLDNHDGGEVASGGGMSMDDVMALLAQVGGGGGSRRARMPRIVGPEGRDLMRHLQAGGRALFGTPAVTEAIWDTPLYRDVLGLKYVRRWDRGFEFTAANAKELADDRKLSLDLATKRESITILAPVDGAEGVQPFALLPDGQWIGAKVARRDAASGKELRAVVLGFYLADVKGADDRRALLAEALRFLERQPNDADLSAAATAPATDAPAPVEAGAGSGGGN